MCTGGSIENILDNIGASCESLSSLIPQEKQILDFEKRLEVLEDKEESDIDSGT